MIYGFEFDIEKNGEFEGHSIVYMQCWMTENYVQVKKLPFTLTVQEIGGRHVGILDLTEKEIYTVWIEEENEDDYFNHAHNLVEGWIFDFSFPR